MSEFERITELRRTWMAPDEVQLDLCVSELVGAPAPPMRRYQASVEAGGIRYQRCGGGSRVLRRRVGGE